MHIITAVKTEFVLVVQRSECLTMRNLPAACLVLCATISVGKKLTLVEVVLYNRQYANELSSGLFASASENTDGSNESREHRVRKELLALYELAPSSHSCNFVSNALGVCI